MYSSPVEKSLFKVLVIATGFLQRHCPALLFQEGQYAAGRRLSSWVKTGFWEVTSSYLQSHSWHPTRANKKPRTSSFTTSHAQIRVRLPVFWRSVPKTHLGLHRAACLLRSTLCICVVRLRPLSSVRVAELGIFISSSASLIPYTFLHPTFLSTSVCGTVVISIVYVYLSVYETEIHLRLSSFELISVKLVDDCLSVERSQCWRQTVPSWIYVPDPPVSS